LDAGCGTGAASFETKSQYPSTTIYGINLALNQLQSARTFAEVSEVPGSFFVLQDYISTAFQSETFNKIMFIESVAHAQTKRAALQESKRILKPGGILTVADIFFQREPTTDEEREWVSDLARGWFMPNLNSIDVFKEELEDEGFEIASERNISENILPSTLRMRLNSEQRMIEEKVMETVSKEIYWSRKAVIASHKVVESGLIGYYLLNAKLK